MMAAKVVSYPIRVRSNAGTIANLETDEYGAWEDAGKPESFDEWSRITDDRNDPSLTVIVLGRFKTLIEIRNADEARAVLYSCNYWKDQDGLCDPRWSYGAALARLATRIRREMENECSPTP